MSREKECKCCHEWWYASDVKEGLCPNCYDYFKQLKQQLEEYENKGNTSAVNSWDEMLKNCENCGLNECIGCEYTQTCVQNIKQQLDEKDKEINSLIVDYEKRISQEQELMSNMEHRLAEKQNTIDEINKEFVQAVHDWKTLCAKKDKEIETMKKDSDKNIDYLVEFASLIENEKDCNRMLKALDRVKSGNKYIIDKANQSKTEFAIEKLQKLKDVCDKKLDWWEKNGFEDDIYDKLDVSNAYFDVSANVEEIIKELKGE